MLAKIALTSFNHHFGDMDRRIIKLDILINLPAEALDSRETMKATSRNPGSSILYGLCKCYNDSHARIFSFTA